MLFNSYIFIFAFLPITLIIYFLLAKKRWIKAAVTWLAMASLFFYAYCNPVYLILLLVSIGITAVCDVIKYSSTREGLFIPTQYTLA